MLFYPTLERPRASALVGVRAWACTACVASGASPALLACVAPAAVPRAGLHSWGEPGGRAAAWCTSPYPPFFFFPSRFLLLGPSLWQHMQLHSDIPSFITANLPSPPPNPPHNRGTASVCALLTRWTNFHVSHKNTDGAKMRMLILHTSILGNILFLHEGFSQILYQFHKNEARGWDKCIQESLRAAIRRPFGKASVTVYVSGIWFSNDKIKT